MTDHPGRCETGGCITVTYEADHVHITETERPDQTVTTSRTNWDTFINGIEAPLRAEVERLKATQQPDDGTWFDEHGLINSNTGEFVGCRSEGEARLLGTRFDRLAHHRRVWYGPVEPITTDGDYDLVPAPVPYDC